MTALLPRPSMPTTPKSPGYLLSSNTPRSRRVTLNNQQMTPSRAIAITFPPLPSLLTRPYKEVHYTEDDEGFLEGLEESTRELEDAFQRLSSSLSERKRDLTSTMTELEDQKRSSEIEIKLLMEKVKDVKMELSKEVEDAKEAKMKSGELSNQESAWAGQIEQLNMEVEEERRKLKAKREIKLQQTEAFRRQASKNAPECAFFEEKLGLKIQGQGRDLINFKFTNLDRKSYTRAFSFNVDVSKSDYTVAFEKPHNYLPAQILSSLVNKLNEDRNLYAFLRSMREALANEVELEHAYPGASEVEKVKKRSELKVLGERNMA